MKRSKEELLKQLSDCVVEMEDEAIKDVSKEYLAAGYNPLEGILDGLVVGMNKAGEMFEKDEYFITDILLCSDAMNNGIDILKPFIPTNIDNQDKICKVVIGVIEGDTHDIGKNLVKIMLESAQFEVLDLGKDVSPITFVEKAKDINADIICISTLMTTTMPGMMKVIDILKENQMYEKVKVMIGGGPVSQAYANKIQAHGYSRNAIDAVKLAKSLY